MKNELFNNFVIFWIEIYVMYLVTDFIKPRYIESAKLMMDGTKAFELHLFHVAIMVSLIPIAWLITDYALKWLIKKFS